MFILMEHKNFYSIISFEHVLQQQQQEIQNTHTSGSLTLPHTHTQTHNAFFRLSCDKTMICTITITIHLTHSQNERENLKIL